MSSNTAASGSGSNPPVAKAPPKPPVIVPGTGNNIIVNPCQRGNPVLECIRNVGKEFGEIVADYQVGRTTGVLFLSLRYHRLHPEYIHQRIEKLGRSYNLRILLLMCDVSEHQEPIRELTKICLINDITIMTAWNAEEAGYYLATYKQFEHKPADMIKERVDKDYHSVLRTALTSISKVNKTDVETLRTSFGSFAAMSHATNQQLQNLPGFGQVKARRIQEAFNKPFRTAGAGARTGHTQTQLPLPPAAAADKGKGKGKERAEAPSERPVREPSPVWDIELDLATPEPEAGPPPVAASRKRPPSPVWDIELDLNDSEPEDADMDMGDRAEGGERERKRLREGSPDFGEPGLLLTS